MFIASYRIPNSFPLVNILDSSRGPPAANPRGPTDPFWRTPQPLGGRPPRTPFGRPTRLYSPPAADPHGPPDPLWPTPAALGRPARSADPLWPAPDQFRVYMELFNKKRERERSLSIYSNI